MCYYLKFCLTLGFSISSKMCFRLGGDQCLQCKTVNSEEVIGLQGGNIYLFLLQNVLILLQGFLDHPPLITPDILPLSLAFLEIPQPIKRYHQHNPVFIPQCRQKLHNCRTVYRKLKFQLLTSKHDKMYLVKQINQAKSQSID